MKPPTSLRQAQADPKAMIARVTYDITHKLRVMLKALLDSRSLRFHGHSLESLPLPYNPYLKLLFQSQSTLSGKEGAKRPCKSEPCVSSLKQEYPTHVYT